MVVPLCLRSFTQLIVLLILLTSSNSQNPSWRIDDEGCITPMLKQGNCVPVRTCPEMMKALLTVQRPLSKTARKQLESYICKIADEYKVCCPSEPIIIKDEKRPVYDEFTTSNGNEEDTSVTSHSNFNLLPTDCGFFDVASIRVINGQNADLTEFPWMTLLSYRGYDNKAQFKCGGTIINERYILTAAHCLEDRSRLIGVRVGEYDIKSKKDCSNVVCNEPVQDLAIEEIIPHPGYDKKGKNNDIGLLRVTPISLNQNNRRPVCLPRGRTKEVNSEYVEVSGWGITKELSSRTSDILQKGYLRVVDKAECQSIYQNFANINVDERRICAGGGKNKTNACHGDSGGPIQVQERINTDIRYVQHGIVSVGMTRCDSPAIFTKVSYYMDWILDTIKP